MKLRRRTLLIAALVYTSGLLPGCHDKSKECDQLIGVMNRQGDSIRAATKKLGESNEDITAIQAIAGAMDKAASSVKKVKLKDEKLKGFAGEYEKLMHSGATAARDMAEAAKAGKPEDTQKANERIRQAQKTEAELVRKINTYCGR